MILIEIPKKVIDDEKEVLRKSLDMMMGDGKDAAYMEGALNALDWVLGKHQYHIKCNLPQSC